jgi:formylmethanofuran dehydrogenase subunit D
MKAREFLLLVLIVVAGVFFYQARTGEIRIEGDWEGPFGGGHMYDFEEPLTLEGPIPARIEVRNAHGDVEVRGADQETVTVTLLKKVRRRTEAEARTVADGLKPVIVRDAGRLEISTNRESFPKKSFTTSFRLVVPSGADVVVVNSYGTVTASGVRRCAIDNPHGQVNAADVAEELSVTNSYEDVAITRVGAACRVSSRHADVLVRQAGSDVRIDHAYGKVEVSDAAAEATIAGEHTEVSLLRVKGAVDVRTTYEDVSLVDIGPATVVGQHADVAADGVGGALKVATTYARVRANGVRGDLDVEGRSVGVVGRSIAAGTIRIATSYEDLDLADFTGRADISVSHADAVLAPGAITSAIDVKNVYGTVRFFWPKGARFPFVGRSKGGEVKWGLAERPDVETTNGESLVKAFAGAAEGPSVTLSTSYGDVVVEEAERPGAEKAPGR